MELTVKNKRYTVIENIDENTFKVSYKDKVFIIKTFSEESFETFVKHSRELKITGIPIRKVLKVDKKEKTALIEYVPYAHTVLEELINDNPSELCLKEIFKISWYAKHGNLNLNYKPDNFAFYKDKMYYLSYEMEYGFDKAKSFELEGIRYWFYTKEFINYLAAKGREYDKSRLKDEYKTNKEIVLAVCRYSR